MRELASTFWYPVLHYCGFLNAGSCLFWLFPYTLHSKVKTYSYTNPCVDTAPCGMH